MQDQMAAFAERLDRMLGGQIAQAKELQLQTLRSLEGALAAFHDMAKTIGTTSESATQAMVNQLRAGLSRSQAETDANIKELLGKLSTHVSNSVAALEQHSAQTSKLAIEHQQRLAEHADRSIERLAGEVRTQTQAIEIAAQSMRNAGADVANAVDRIVEGMTGLVSGAAQEFTRTGQSFADLFEKSLAANNELGRTAAALSASSEDIGAVVNDYRSAQESLGGMVDLIRTTVETARGDASLTSDVVARMETAASKLVSAQGQADEYLTRLTGALSEANQSAKVLETVRGVQAQLNDALPPPASAEPAPQQPSRHTDLDRMISDWVNSTPRLIPDAPPDFDGRDEELMAAAGPLRGTVRT
jgi:hypothetical protein